MLNYQVFSFYFQAELHLKKFQTFKIEQDPFHFAIIKEEESKDHDLFEQQINENIFDDNFTEDTIIDYDNQIQSENPDNSWKKSRKDWVKNHSNDVQCYKCAAIVLKDEIEAHLIQVHDCHIKGDFGPIRQNKCELCGRAYIKVDYFQKVYSKNLTDYSTLKVS